MPCPLLAVGTHGRSEYSVLQCDQCTPQALLHRGKRDAKLGATTVLRTVPRSSSNG